MSALAVLFALGSAFVMVSAVLAARALDAFTWRAARGDLACAAVLFGFGLAMLALVISGIN